MMMKAEWQPRTEFAEFAEALGVPTDQVVSLTTVGLPRWHYMVMFSRDAESDDPPVYGRVLKRDRAGILRPDGPEREVPGFWAGLRAALGQP